MEIDHSQRCWDCFHFIKGQLDTGMCTKIVDGSYILTPPMCSCEELSGQDLGCNWEHFIPRSKDAPSSSDS